MCACVCPRDARMRMRTKPQVGEANFCTQTYTCWFSFSFLAPLSLSFSLRCPFFLLILSSDAQTQTPYQTQRRWNVNRTLRSLFSCYKMLSEFSSSIFRNPEVDWPNILTTIIATPLVGKGGLLSHPRTTDVFSGLCGANIWELLLFYYALWL